MNQLLQKYPILKKGEPIYKSCKDFYEKNTKNCLIGGVILLVVMSFYAGKTQQKTETITKMQDFYDSFANGHLSDKGTQQLIDNGCNLMYVTDQKIIPAKH